MSSGPPEGMRPNRLEASSLAKTRQFCRYHHITSPLYHSLPRRMSKGRTLAREVSGPQYDGHCSLMWPVPP